MDDGKSPLPHLSGASSTGVVLREIIIRSESPLSQCCISAWCICTVSDGPVKPLLIGGSCCGGRHTGFSVDVITLVRDRDGIAAGVETNVSSSETCHDCSGTSQFRIHFPSLAGLNRVRLV